MHPPTHAHACFLFVLSRRFAGALLGSALLLAAPAASAATLVCDVCVYGGTSGGVASAVQAARMGKSVVLVSDYGHLGGMSSSGLGATDIGDSRILGGLSKEFYQRIGLHYTGSSSVQLAFEPHVAEKVFDELVAEQSNLVVTNGLIHLAAGVTMDGTRITALHLEDGTRIEADMYIDACYEGDLMALAGVSFTIGRESNGQYGETGNGIRGSGGNQLPNGVNAYVVPGDPASGLLPGVNPDLGGSIGDADHRLQAYCYRMCLTDVATNRIMVAQPAGYNEADYEILFRAIEAGQSGLFWKTTAMPNGKTDSNNASGISCDFIGRNYSPLPPTHPDYWDWSTLDHAARAALAAQHRDWQLGLIWSVQNHPQVPQAIRDAWGVWGLCADEFTDNGHWPYNLYVREARRMISDYVMTEGNALGSITVTDSVGMGAYTLDSHNTQRVLSAGNVKNEGDIQRGVSNPYAISYRSIIPAAGECDNLLVPWCTSSSHIAFGSIRMEPVFMHLGQSAATAACLAIDDQVAVQQLNYTKLSLQMLAQGQVLSLAAPPAAPTEVWLFVADDQVTEGEGRFALDPAYITVGRTGSTTDALSVTLTVEGTATAGLDYPALTNPVVIPAGKSAVSIRVDAFWDKLVEPDETIEIGLILPGGYSAGAVTSATITVRDTPPVTYAGVAHRSTTKISGSSNFNLSVYPGKARYSGLASGIFGDGTVEAFALFRNDAVPGAITAYAQGGSLLSDPTYASVTTFAEFERGDVWTTADPDSAPADFGGTTATISGAGTVSGLIDISNLSTGTVYVLVGGYDNVFAVDMTLQGEGEWDLPDAAPTIDPVTDRNMYVVAFAFDNAWAKYDTLAYRYTGSASNRARFMGVVVDASVHSQVDYSRWAAGFPPHVLGGPEEDYDLDGIPNDQERIWGLNPTLGNPFPSVLSVVEGGEGLLSYSRRDPALSGATFHYEWATTLNPPDWQPFTPQEESIESVGPLQTLNVLPLPAVLAHPLVYLRVVADPQ